jgi:acetylornithine deacetylase/succinyl-diaminopimelate desuccinylase-like protein
MNIQNYIADNKDRFLQELLELLRIPSVSADAKFKDDVLKTADWVAEKLRAAGAENIEICATAGYPIIYAEKITDATKPTVLVYGHYDVQPADPYDLWDSPPFEPVIKKTALHPEGAIFARGAADDKGQFYMHIKALEYMTHVGSLPCNLKFLIEGEEEVGSANLGIFVEANKLRLAADVVLISDTHMVANDIPSITSGLRGLSYVEVEVSGPNRDLHSGLYGGAVANPANVLCAMIASLHDANGRITIPEFYDDVQDLTADERNELGKVPFSQTDYNKLLDLTDVSGEVGYTTPERASIRPTLDVNGMWSGYTGAGAKTVLPAKAYAKISMRLVPNQTPDRATQLFTKHFESIAPPTVRVKVTPHHGGFPAVTPTDSPAFKAASRACEVTFGKPAIPMRGGGSIPIVAMFEEKLGIKTVLLGFGLDTDALHSPNEHYGLFNYYKGIETLPYFFEFYGANSL